ncbi:MAG: PKD domain-containing protein, partial [Candidatus Eisenbacteria bacterium]
MSTGISHRHGFARGRPGLGIAAVALLLAASAASLFSGCSGRSITIPTNQKPTVTAVGTPLNGNPPLTVAFTTTASDPDGRIVDVFWNFKDGSTSTELNPTHQFTTIGFFRATVTVRDEWGAADSFEVSVNVSPNTRPVAAAGPNQTNRDPATTITLNGSGSDADAGQTITYLWTQIGGTAVTLSNPNSATTTFTTPAATTATYTFRLTVTDNGSPQASATSDVSVSTRVTYANTAAGIFNSRCDAPGLGPTCHPNDSPPRIRLNTWTAVSEGGVDRDGDVGDRDDDGSLMPCSVPEIPRAGRSGG